MGAQAQDAARRYLDPTVVVRPARGSACVVFVVDGDSLSWVALRARNITPDSVRSIEIIKTPATSRPLPGDACPIVVIETTAAKPARAR